VDDARVFQGQHRATRRCGLNAAANPTKHAARMIRAGRSFVRVSRFAAVLGVDSSVAGKRVAWGTSCEAAWPELAPRATRFAAFYVHYTHACGGPNLENLENLDRIWNLGPNLGRTGFGRPDLGPFTSFRVDRERRDRLALLWLLHFPYVRQTQSAGGAPRCLHLDSLLPQLGLPVPRAAMFFRARSTPKRPEPQAAHQAAKAQVQVPRPRHLPPGVQA
jgi:hypothetical protein